MTKITKKPVSLFMLLFATLSFTAAAQSSSTPHQMGIKIIPLSQDVEKVSLSQTSKIETKIQRLVSNYGLSAIEHIQNLVIYFKYEIYEENTIKTVPKYVYTVKAKLNLRILETKSQIEFGNYSQTLKGEGYTIDAAIDKSIARFQTRNSEVKEFVIGVKEKILAYYRKAPDTVNPPCLPSDTDWLCENHRIGCH